MTELSKSAALLAAAFACTAFPVHAQNYPEKPIRLIVPFAPGGSTDFLARILGLKFTEAWKQPVLIDNRGVGGGTIGADLAAKAPADGYTIVLSAISHATAVGFYKKLPYDLLTDLQAVSLIATQPNTLAVHPSVPAKSLKEFIALARAKPGQLPFSTAGNGSAQHLMGEMFNTMTKVKLIHIAYKGTAPAMTDLVSGQVVVSIQPVINAAPNAKAGRIRLLAVTGGKRSPVVPEVPTMAEAGVPGYSVVAWYGIHAPARVPRPIVDTLSREMIRILGAADVKERLLTQGMDPSPNTPDECGAFVKAEVNQWRKVIQDANIQAD